MNKEIFKFLKDYESDPFTIDRLIISTFVKCNNISFSKNELIKKYVINSDSKNENNKLEEFLSLLKKYSIEVITFETLIELFEFVVSPSDKEVNGAVYTPENIRKFIINGVFEKFRHSAKNLKDITIADVACGCGSFLFDIAKLLKFLTSSSYNEIFNQNLFGLDIKEYSINRSKLILILLAITEGEDLEEFSFNLFTGNALSFDWKQIYHAKNLNEGFDSVVGNPPYVGSTKIDSETKLMLKNWSVSNTGKSDLYIPFFQIGLSNLKPGGILGFITVNSFLKSLNGKDLRNYFSANGFGIEIIDFGSEQIFRGRSTYTCICLIENTTVENIRYLQCNSSQIATLTDQNFLSIKYSNLNNTDGWILRDAQIIKTIAKIQSAGKPLDELFEIRNGFATLLNDVYVFKKTHEDELYFYFSKNDRQFKVEKEICRKAIKPNILKNESDLDELQEFIIFPYVTAVKQEKDNFKREAKVIDESDFKSSFPLAYEYLNLHSKLLKNRDKGNRTYEKWYSFGRTQALSLHGKKLLFPYIADKPYFIYTNDENLLFYNGYAIFSNDERELLVLKKIVSSHIFWYYIQHASKPYESKYFSLAKNHIKHFGVVSLSEKEKSLIVNLTQEQANKMLEKKYDIKI